MAEEESKLSENDVKFNERIEKINENICYLGTESTKLDDNYFARLKLLALEDKDEKALEEYNKLNEIYHLPKNKKDELLLNDENGDLILSKYNLTPESYMYVISYYLDFANFKNLFKVEKINGKRSLRINRLGIKNSEIARLICDTKNKYLRNALLLEKIENDNGEDIPVINYLFSNDEEIKRVLCGSKVLNIEIVKNIIRGDYGDFGDDNLDIILLNCNLRILEELLKDEKLFAGKSELKGELKEKLDILKELTNKEGIIETLKDIKIPPDMTIGVELEMVGPLSYCLYGDLIGEFRGKEDSTIEEKNYKAVEIVSPILKSQNVNNALYMAEKLTALGGFTNKTCGGHIHIGSDYFTIKNPSGNVDLDASKLAWKSFLELWQNTEEIMYKITTKEGENHRGIKFAKPIAPKLESFLQSGGFDINNNKWILESKANLRDVQLEGESIVSERNFAINFDNLNNNKNTIEFRLANGTLDKDELAANIILFSKMMEVSKKLGIAENKRVKRESLTKEEEKVLNIKDELTGNLEIDEITKFEKLMELLFNDEKSKEIYKRRYNSSSFNLEAAKKEMNEENECNSNEYGAPLSDKDMRRIQKLNKNIRNERDIIAEEREIRYREQDFDELTKACMQEMPNKFQEVISKIKGFLEKVREKIIVRDR